MNKFSISPEPSRTEAMITYLMMGEDGLYTFTDPESKLAHQVGFLTAAGFTLLGIHGVNGCNLEVNNG